MVLLATCLGGAWTLEQPRGSCLNFYPTFRYMLGRIFASGGPEAVAWLSLALFWTVQVCIVRWWMAHYNAPTAKRHWMYGNSPRILDLDKGRLTGWRRPEKAKQTTRGYHDKQGKRRYVGTSNLRKSECLRIRTSCGITLMNSVRYILIY